MRIRRIGNSLGFLPKELLARLRLRKGDKLHLIEQGDRGLELSPDNPQTRRSDSDRAPGFPRLRRYVQSAGQMIEPVWFDREIVLDIYSEHLALCGGPSGARNVGLLDSALARPRNRSGYGEKDLAALV